MRVRAYHQGPRPFGWQPKPSRASQLPLGGCGGPSLLGVDFHFQLENELPALTLPERSTPPPAPKKHLNVFCKTCVRRITGPVVKTRVRKQEVAGSNPGEVICFLVLDWEAYLSYVYVVFILYLPYMCLMFVLCLSYTILGEIFSWRSSPRRSSPRRSSPRRSSPRRSSSGDPLPEILVLWRVGEALWELPPPPQRLHPAGVTYF